MGRTQVSMSTTTSVWKDLLISLLTYLKGVPLSRLGSPLTPGVVRPSMSESAYSIFLILSVVPPFGTNIFIGFNHCFSFNISI